MEKGAHRMMAASKDNCSGRPLAVLRRIAIQPVVTR